MTIPQFYIGPRFTPGKVLHGVSILDIAPTVADLMGFSPAGEWTGRSLAES
jgi:arylsulfatase A-like enzyme